MSAKIPISDKKLISYLIYKNVPIVSRERNDRVVTFSYPNDITTNDIINQFATDTEYQKYISATHATEELLRATI